MNEKDDELTYSFLNVLSTKQETNAINPVSINTIPNPPVKHLQIKIILIGEGAVGKTALRLKFMGEESTHGMYISTLGADFSLKYIDLEDYSILLQIWDLAGQSRFKDIVSNYFAGANGALVVYDLTRMDTFDQVKYWIDHLFSITGPIPFCILGNKLDISPQNQIFESLISDADSTIKKLNDLIKKDFGFEVHHFLTSAANGIHVEEAFSLLVKQIIEYMGNAQLKVTQT